MLWIGLLSFLAQPVAADDECERVTSTGDTRDCTYLEEMRECVDDVNDSYDDCMDDAFSSDGFFETAGNVIGCELAFDVNLVACAIGVSMDWLL
jgi:hypothetical protein